MLLSLPSWDYFQCKSPLLECAVLIMTQKLLWLLLWGMISFCSNAQRNVLLPNCCSRQLICRFFPVSGEMSHSCFGFYLSGLPGGGRVGKGRGLEPSQPRNLLWPSPGLSPPWGSRAGGVSALALLRSQPGSGPWALQVWFIPSMRRFHPGAVWVHSFHFALSGVLTSHTLREGLSVPNNSWWSWLGPVLALQTNLFPVYHFLIRI